MTFNDCKVFAFMNHDLLTPLPLCLLDFGIEYRENESYYFDNTNRSDYPGYLFQYTLEGTGYFETAEQRIELKRGMGFFISLPHQSHYYLASGKYWKFFYLHFDGTVIAQFYEQIIQKSGNTFSLNNTGDTTQLLLKEFESVKNGKKYKRYEAGAFLYQFLSCLLYEIESPNSATKNSAERGHEWLERNYASHHSLSEMCNELQITLPHFSRQFHEKYGITPMEYLTRIRLEHSLQLLLNTNLSIQEIALRCGFGSGNYYAKIFHKALGISPTQYRIQHGINRFLT